MISFSAKIHASTDVPASVISTLLSPKSWLFGLRSLDSDEVARERAAAFMSSLQRLRAARPAKSRFEFDMVIFLKATSNFFLGPLFRNETTSKIRQIAISTGVGFLVDDD